MTLNGVITTLRWLLSLRLAIVVFYHHRNNITVCDVGFTVRQRVVLFIKKLSTSKFVFYVVLFELMVKIFSVISFATIIGSYRSFDTITKQSAKIGSSVKCRFRHAGCEEVPMCKVPGKVLGCTVALRHSEASCYMTCTLGKSNVYLKQVARF